MFLGQHIKVGTIIEQPSVGSRGNLAPTVSDWTLGMRTFDVPNLPQTLVHGEGIFGIRLRRRKKITEIYNYTQIAAANRGG